MNYRSKYLLKKMSGLALILFLGLIMAGGMLPDLIGVTQSAEALATARW